LSGCEDDDMQPGSSSGYGSTSKQHSHHHQHQQSQQQYLQVPHPKFKGGKKLADDDDDDFEDESGESDDEEGMMMTSMQNRYNGNRSGPGVVDGLSARSLLGSVTTNPTTPANFDYDHVTIIDKGGVTVTSL
jgi:hypothetical protein